MENEKQPGVVGAQATVGELFKLVRVLTKRGFKRVMPLGADGKPLSNTPLTESKAIKLLRDKAGEVAGLAVKTTWYYHRYFNFATAVLIIHDVARATGLLNNVLGEWRAKLCGSVDAYCMYEESSNRYTILIRYPVVVHVVAVDASGRLTGRAKATSSGIELITHDLVPIYRVDWVPVRYISGQWVPIDAVDVGVGVVLSEKEITYLARSLGLEVL